MLVVVATTSKRDRKSGGASNVRATVISWINFELAARGGLDPIGHRFRDMALVVLGPLTDSAACHANGSGDGSSIPIEVRKHGRLKHAKQSTAC